METRSLQIDTAVSNMLLGTHLMVTVNFAPKSLDEVCHVIETLKLDLVNLTRRSTSVAFSNRSSSSCLHLVLRYSSQQAMDQPWRDGRSHRLRDIRNESLQTNGVDIPQLLLPIEKERA